MCSSKPSRLGVRKTEGEIKLFYNTTKPKGTSCGNSQPKKLVLTFNRQSGPFILAAKRVLCSDGVFSLILHLNPGHLQLILWPLIFLHVFVTLSKNSIIFKPNQNNDGMSITTKTHNAVHQNTINTSNVNFTMDMKKTGICIFFYIKIEVSEYMQNQYILISDITER